MTWLIIEIVVFLLGPVSMEYPGSDSDFSHDQESCSNCHSDKVEHEVMHEAIENGCDICHESTGEAHPGEGEKGFKLVDQVPALCYYCHEEPGTPSFAHQPVEDGQCLSCHEVHGSSNFVILKLPGEELCLSCHPIAQGQALIHSAIPNGGCSLCHQPHGAEYRSLLVETYPEDEYVPALTENFELCFMCHDVDLMNAEQTDWATNFRDGDRNLHQLHIHGEKGRNCKLCHNLHVSKQKFLIKESVVFGNWEMQMNFMENENGGSCLPGCHGQKTYDRLKNEGL